VRNKILICSLVVALCVSAAAAQFGRGIVYDPTNYHNALLRYFQLQQHLVQLQKSYAQLVSQYNLAVHMARNLENMPARYRATFSQWRNGSALDAFGNTAGWIAGINSGNVGGGYRMSTTELLPYRPDHLSAMDANELSRVQSQYASVQLADGANTTAIATIGSIRNHALSVENRMANLDSDSFSADPNLNSEVSVLNKINAASVLTLRSIQDSNKLLASLLEQQIVSAKQQREMTANAINAEIGRRAILAGNLTEVSSTLTDSLQNFRMP
jgi:hypothetical protein